MKKIGIFLLTLFICIDLTTGVLFAQTTTPAPTSDIAKTTDPTPTQKVTQPPTTPAPTTAPSVQVTDDPTSPVAEPTSVPVQSPQTPNPTATPTPPPPTPTPNPKPLALTSNTKPPSSPLSQIITAPFALVMNSLPQSYYDDQGLTPGTNEILLTLAFICLTGGTVLLTWPSLVKTKNRLFASRVKEGKVFPYLAGRA